jgi:vitamin B12 transporter
MFAFFAVPLVDVMAQEGSGVGGESDILGTVIVSASRAAERLREVSSNVTIISGEEIEQAPVSDLSDVLVQQGFWLVDWGASKYVQVRGMSSNQSTQAQSSVLILVNGRRTGVTEVNQVQVENVERIEIIRGPSAVQYGSSAFGGVINVITKKSETDGVSAVLETGVGSYGLNRDSLSVNGRHAGFDFSLGGMYEKRDDYSIKGGIRWPHTAKENKSFMVEAGYTFLDKHRIGVNYSHHRNNSEFPGEGIADTLINIAEGTPIRYNNFVFTNKSGGVNYDGATQDEKFHWSMFYQKSEDNKLTTGIYDPTIVKQDTVNYGASLGYSGQYFAIDVGFDYIEYDIFGQFQGNNLSKDLGAYISSKIKLLDDSLFISLGGRYDKFSFENREPVSTMSETNFSPSVGVSYLPLNWLKLRANYSKGFRMPSAFEILGAPFNMYPYLPNPDLKPEKSETWEFGFDVDYEFLSSSFTFFHTDWIDMIDDEYDWQTWVSRYINMDEAEIAGIEIALSADLGQAFDLGYQIRPHFNFTYMTTRKNKDLQYLAAHGVDTLQNVPRWTLAYGLTFNHPGMDLTVSANALHVGPMFSAFYLSHGGQSFDFNWGSHFAALDLALEKGLWEIGDGGRLGKVKLRIEAKNILDSQNMVYHDYPGYGRNFYVGLKYVY